MKTKKNKVTFKTHKEKGKWGWIHEPTHHVKLNGKEIGTIDNNQPYKIRLMKMKDDPMEDGNPNCKWMWISLKKQSASLQEAKDFITEKIEEILSKYNIYQLEE